MLKKKNIGRIMGKEKAHYHTVDGVEEDDVDTDSHHVRSE